MPYSCSCITLITLYRRLVYGVCASVVLSMFALSVFSPPTAAVSGQADQVPRTTLCAGVPTGNFSDVSTDHRLADAIDCLAYWGISIGTGDGTEFSPEATITRAQMAVFLVRTFDLLQGHEYPTDRTPPDFTDLGDVWPGGRAAILRIYALDMSVGHTETQYRPRDTVTRAEMALFLVRLLQRTSCAVFVDETGIYAYDHSCRPFKTDDRFSDADAYSPEVGDAVSILYELGITTGSSTGLFSPSAPVKRAQMAAFLTRSMQLTRYIPTTPLSNTDSSIPGITSVSIIVPVSSPAGHCASLISTEDVYAWETCALDLARVAGVSISNFDHLEAVSLAERIWVEVSLVGKPALPPEIDTQLNGMECGTDPGITGCYLLGAHRLIRHSLDGYTLLHELAHALTSEHPTVSDCVNSIDVGICAHNDIFRCAAQYLYTTYAGMPDPGVCGTTTWPNIV